VLLEGRGADQQQAESQFEETVYEKQMESMTATLVGRSSVTEDLRERPITRIYGLFRGEPGIISTLPEPVLLKSVDEFEAMLFMRQTDYLSPLAFAKSQVAGALP
jgi:hypothetical protein